MKKTYNFALVVLLFASPVAAFAKTSAAASEPQIERRSVVESAADVNRERLRQSTTYAELMLQLSNVVRDSAAARIAADGVSSATPAAAPASPATASLPYALTGSSGAAASVL